MWDVYALVNDPNTDVENFQHGLVGTLVPQHGCKGAAGVEMAPDIWAALHGQPAAEMLQSATALPTPVPSVVLMGMSFKGECS